MSLGERLLRAVLDHPKDDRPRLVYADWLEEQDDPRGELIRVQLRLHQKCCPQVLKGLRARDRELRRRHAVTWLGRVMPRLTGWEFRRGFVDEVTLKAHVYLGPARELLDREPVRCVRMSRATGNFSALAGSSLLARLAELDLSRNHLNDAAVAELTASPHLERLRALRLAYNFIRESGALLLADCPQLGNLRLLDLSGNFLSAAAKTALRDRFGGAVRF